MSASTNTQKVQEIYAAFGRGDIRAIINSLAEEVDWQTFGPSVIPQTGPHRGPGEVEKFFGKVATAYDITTFEPREFVAEGDNVVVLGYYTATVRATGKKYAVEWAMRWSFKNGKVVKWREYVDTATLAAALTA